MPDQTYRDKVVIVTGASSGIGRALALLLAEQGARLALGARNLARLQEVAAACETRGGKALAIQTDVSKEGDCRWLVDHTADTCGGVDLLINNAGITMWARCDEMETLKPFQDIMRVNYLGSVYCTYFALPHLKRSRGQIVAVASLAGKTGVPLRSGYAASKHAVVGFFDSLRIELAGSGVGISVVYPDFVRTETHARAFGADGAPLGKSPLQAERVMTAEECAQHILAAAASRRRDTILGLRGRLGLWLKLIAPGLVDRMASRAIARGR
jgi:short-subunit dehydrogenase